MKHSILATIIALSLSASAQAATSVPAEQAQQCYTLPQGNVAVCINLQTLQPCSVVNDTIEAHVKARRARMSNGQAYLVGSNIGIGNSGTYNVSSYDGLAWYAGECN